MKVMISLPMNGKNDDEVRARITYLKNEFAKLHIDVVDSFITDEIEGSNYPGVYYLGRTLMKFMHNVDAVYFDDGWFEARGCRIENAVCQEYGIKILDFNFLYGPKLKRIMNPPIKDEIEPQIQQLEQILQEKRPNGTPNLKLVKNQEDDNIDRT